MASTIFSDSWYRVSGLRVALLSSVEVRAQTFRGQNWFILQDTYTQRYFRTSEQACKFILSLTRDKTVEDVWEDFVNHYPESAPSQEEVIQMLSQLHLSNLLYSLEQADNEAIVARYRKQKNKELLGKFASFLYVRLPLWNPDRLLNRITPVVRLFTGWLAFGVWLAVLLLGIFTAFQHREALIDQSQGVLSISNLPWLYVCLSVLKLFHEAGHAFVCKRYGGEVRTFGVMFLLLTPLPYVDATSSWGFSNRWQRIYASFAGMAVEFFFAAGAVVVWAVTGPGLTNSLAFNIMFIGSISSLLFNGNPLLRFDAYYMLSDFAEIPNLYQKSQQQWKYFGDRYILGTTTATGKASDTREWYWLTIYGCLSFIYLMMVTFGISLFLMDHWLPLGLLVLAMTLYSKLAVPLYQLFQHMISSKTAPNRRRAVCTVAGITIALVILTGVIPWPDSVRASGILQANGSNVIYLQTPGRLDTLYVRHGGKVVAGQLLVSLHSTDLLTELDAAQHAREEASIQYLQALHNSTHEIEATQQQLDTLDQRLADLNSQLSKLEIHADQDGEWVASELHEMVGSWLPRGYAVGEIVNRRSFRFLAVIPQEQAEYLFRNSFKKIELRLSGQVDNTLPVTQINIIPFQSQKLPSLSLGWTGGGDIPVTSNESSGARAKESFYTLYADIATAQLPAITALHGLSGTLRIQLAPQPAAMQLYRAIKQLVQKRYAL